MNEIVTKMGDRKKTYTIPKYMTRIMKFVQNNKKLLKIKGIDTKRT